MKADPNSKRSLRRRQKRTIRHGTKLSCFVYALTDEAGAIRYVGQTRQPLQDRLRWHHRRARPDGAPVQRWLCDAKPTIVMLDRTATWDVSEILWIEKLRRAGERLLNVTRGGNDTIHELARASALPD